IVAQEERRLVVAALRYDRVDVAVRLEKVRAAVVVEVGKDESPADEFLCERIHMRLVRRLLKRPAAEVSIHPRAFAAEVAVRQVEASVAVEVGNVDGHAPLGMAE